MKCNYTDEVINKFIIIIFYSFVIVLKLTILKEISVHEL